MTESAISAVVKNANTFLKQQFETFYECNWNEDEQCFEYQFGSDVDAERFILWLQVQGNSRTRKETFYAHLIFVKEYRD